MKPIYAPILVLLFISCSQELTYQEALDKNQKNLETTQAVEDAEFLVNAKSFNLLVLEINQLARESAYASSVVNLSTNNQSDHENLKEELSKLAKREDMRIPTKMSGKHQEYVNELRNTSQADFDKKYIRTLKRVNEEAKNSFLDMATEANDPDIRSFSARNIELLRSHSEQIKEVQDNLLSTY